MQPDSLSCRRLGTTVFAGLALAFSGVASATDPPATPATSASTSMTVPPITIDAPPQWTTVHERDVNSLGAPVGVARLQTMRGGEEKPGSIIIIDGKVEDNTADNVTGGSNIINGGSFGGASGINTIIQNSGTNVLIQSATVVNVNFGGTPL